MAVSKNCEQCNKEFFFYPFDIKDRKFCSLACYWKAKKGSKGYWLGKKRTEFMGENNPKWKGDKVGYYALHTWVIRKLGQPNVCEHCKKIINKSVSIHWANKSGKYQRQLDDWIRLCVPCHRKFDYGRDK